MPINQEAVSKRAKNGIVIFDLDGCVANDEWRRCEIDYSGECVDYDRYHRMSGADEAYPASVRMVKDFAKEYHIAFITARPMKYDSPTRDWIKRVLDLKPLDDYWLYMRSHGNEQASPELKKHIVELMRNNQPDLKFIAAFDDREDVVKAYHSIGVPASVWNGRELMLKGQVNAIPDVSVNAADLFRAIAPNGELDDHLHKAAEALKTGAMDKQIEDAGLKVYKKQDAADILSAAADTYRERNAGYKDNFRKVGAVMAALFPDGVTLATEDDHNFYHLFELMIVKLTRFVNSGLTHTDSIHDLAVYAAMCESLADQHKITIRSAPW